MPYAQEHYPFRPEHTATDSALSQFFPANFIAEGLDQTRGWFYTLLVLGTSLFGKSPYQNVVVNGLILAEDGQKMSKRKKNYPDPNFVLDEYGADALRAYLIDSPVVRGEPLRFSERGLKEIVRTVVLPYWNALSFFTTYANVDGYDPRTWSAPAHAERPDIDRWILSVLSALARDVNQEMEAYRLYAVVPRLVLFIDDLTNWYIRRSRPGFWKSQDDTDKSAAFATLYEVLTTFAKLLAPFMPFVTEMVHQKLVRTVSSDAPASVHYCDYPRGEAAWIDEQLEAKMAAARSVVALGRKLREDHKLKVRQPLARLTIANRSATVRAQLEQMSGLIMEELNVKEVVTTDDESSFSTVIVKPNFAELKKKAPAKLGALRGLIAAFGAAEAARLHAGESIEVEGEAITLSDVILERKTKGDAAVATDGELTVALDTALNEALLAEGHAREFISQLQNARKSAGLEVQDRIAVVYECADLSIRDAIGKHESTIRSETLAKSLEAGQPAAGGEVSTLDVNGVEVLIRIEKSS
jgi:isoleucyl-tRNA synthetase